LATKVQKEGSKESRAYTKYRRWCQDTASNAEHAIESANNKKTKLTAKIDELNSDIDVAGRKIEDLTSAIAQSEAELENATWFREREAAEFSTAETELVDTVETIGRSLHALEEMMAKNPTSLAQVDTTNMKTALGALDVILEGASFSLADHKKLMSFMQSEQGAENSDMELGAPDPAAYKAKSGESGGVVDILQDMKDKADSELSDLRKVEVTAKHNYNMLKDSLSAQLKADNKDLAAEKAGKAEAQEGKADAQGEVEIAVKDLANNQKQLGTCQEACMLVAADHEEAVTSRKEELGVIAKAKEILEKAAQDGPSSFVQVAMTAGVRMQMQTHADLAKSEVVTMVKHLAQRHHSTALAQLASRISMALRFGGRGDVFGKIKGMIKDMIAKLQKDSQHEAEEKVYCDKQMSKTEQKKGELEDDTEKLTSHLDSAAAKSAELKEDIKELEGELAALTKEQAEMDNIRQEENSAFQEASGDLEAGLGGVRKALKLLKDYYGNGAAAAAASASLVQDSSSSTSDGSDAVSFMQQPPAPRSTHVKAHAGDAIIVILEDVESDFATNLAKMESEESDAKSAYDKTTTENQVSKTSKQQDVKFKTQEAKSLDTDMSELSQDRDTSASELAAVNEYYTKVKARCVATPEPYEERKKRRDAEIAGLKEALTILKNEASFMQRKRRSSFRGSSLSSDAL